MPIKSSQALLAALALVAAPAFAQDTTPAATPDDAEPASEQPAEPATTDTTAPEDSAAPATEEAAPADDDAAAEAAPAPAEPEEPKVGSYYLKSTHQDWTLRCIKADQGKDPCELYQLMKDPDGNSVAEMTLIPLSNGNVAAGATLVAPLETDLIEGLGFSVDSGKPRGYPFSFCAPVGCVSRMGFTAAELSGLKRGGKASVTLLPFGGDPKKPVQLSLSLSGFTAAFDELATYAAATKPEAAPASE